MKFEDAMERLEEIVKKLEDGDVQLEESIALYEEGMKLGNKCKHILDEADQRIHRLAAELEEGGKHERLPRDE
jgi:exodeoxyribonuclease VII small subunit